ncbi:MAG: hypothetical protein WBF79_09790 [Rhodococcus sp. (in: high G+C Gram-positive bacteria)]
MNTLRYVAAAAASVVVVIFGSTQTTGALWRDDAVTDAGVVQAGTLDIKVGASGTEVDDYVIDSLGGVGLGPGSFSQAPLSVRNAGNIPMNYRLQSASAAASLAPSLSVVVDRVSATASCPVAAPPSGATVNLYSGPLSSAQGPQRVLAAGESEVLCFRVALTADPPQNSSTTVTFSFLAEQQ